MNFIFNYIINKWYAKEPYFECHGIKVLDDESQDNYNCSFKEVIKSAFNLLEKHDPKRLKRISDSLTYIRDSNTPELYKGLYTPAIRGAIINFKDSPENIHLAGAYYAGVLIDIATKAKINKHNIKITKDVSFRIYKLCAIEKNRFWNKIENLYPNYKGKLVVNNDFNEVKKALKQTSKLRFFYRAIKRIYTNQY